MAYSTYTRTQSRKLSYILRHEHLQTRSADGTCQVADIMQYSKVELTYSTIESIVRGDQGNRYEATWGPSGNLEELRARHGHSLPISSDNYTDLDVEVNPQVFHHTSIRNATGISLNGLQKKNRTCVHLRTTIHPVESRNHSDCIVCVDAKRLTDDGYVLKESTNNIVLLWDDIKPRYILGINRYRMGVVSLL